MSKRLEAALAAVYAAEDAVAQALLIDYAPGRPVCWRNARGWWAGEVVSVDARARRLRVRDSATGAEHDIGATLVFNPDAPAR